MIFVIEEGAIQLKQPPGDGLYHPSSTCLT